MYYTGNEIQDCGPESDEINTKDYTKIYSKEYSKDNPQQSSGKRPATVRSDWFQHNCVFSNS